MFFPVSAVHSLVYGIFLFMPRVFLSFSRFLPYYPSSLFSCMLPPFFLYLYLEGVLSTAFRVFSFVTVCYTILSTAFLVSFVLQTSYTAWRLFTLPCVCFSASSAPSVAFSVYFACFQLSFFFTTYEASCLLHSECSPSVTVSYYIFTVFLCFSKLMTILFCLSSLMFDLQPNYSTRHHLRTAYYFDRGWGSIFSVGKPVPVV